MAVPFTGMAKAITKSGLARSPNRYFTVDGRIKSRHTANEILKQAGIGKQF